MRKLIGEHSVLHKQQLEFVSNVRLCHMADNDWNTDGELRGSSCAMLQASDSVMIRTWGWTQSYLSLPFVSSLKVHSILIYSDSAAMVSATRGFFLRTERIIARGITSRKPQISSPFVLLVWCSGLILHAHSSSCWLFVWTWRLTRQSDALERNELPLLSTTPKHKQPRKRAKGHGGRGTDVTAFFVAVYHFSCLLTAKLLSNII